MSNFFRTSTDGTLCGSFLAGGWTTKESGKLIYSVSAGANNNNLCLRRVALFTFCLKYNTAHKRVALNMQLDYSNKKEITRIEFN